jgi:hypothetical protein
VESTKDKQPEHTSPFLRDKTAEVEVKSKKPPPPHGRPTLQKGMYIEALGVRYKVIAVRPNGKVTMKAIGKVAQK